MLEVLHQGGIHSPKSSLSQEKLMILAQRYQERYPEALNILEITGVSPFGTKEMMNPYIGELDKEDFANVGRHCIAVGYAAEKIADALGVSDEERDRIVTSAILHDGDKRLEVMRKKARNTGVQIDVYGEEGYRTIEKIFSDAGEDPKVLESIKTMGGMTGHNSLKKFLVVKDGKIQLNPERTLADMIVHIADDSTHSSFGELGESTEYVSFEQRAYLGKFSERYPFLWNEGLIFSEKGVQEIKNLSEADKATGFTENYYTWQVRVYEMICQHIASHIAPENIDSIKFLVAIMAGQTSVSDAQETARNGINNILK